MRRQCTDIDVLVIGGGAAALAAAIEARRIGCSVLLAERAPCHLRGGNTRHARNLRLAHLAPTPFSPGAYPPATFWSELQRATQNTADPLLGQRLVEGSLAIADWLQGAGVPLQPIAGHRLPESQRTVFLLGGGKTLVQRLYAHAKHLGIEIRYETEVTDPLLTGGRLLEVCCRKAEYKQLRPRAVIACCGGAQANRAWLARHWGEAADGFINRGSPWVTGEFLAALLEQGAQAVGDPRGAYLVAVDGRSPADDGGIVTRIRGIPEGIVVDQEGRRREDEGGDTASTRYALWGRRLADWPRQIGYLLLDARGLRAAPPALYPPISAATLGELAIQLGIDPEALRLTLDAYHAAIRPPRAPGDDWQALGLLPPKTRRAYPLVEPPFHAYPLRPGITFTAQGLAVGPDTRVRLANGGVVENLFAAGMIMAPNLIPQGYLSGLALTIGLVFGRIAGSEAARYVRC
ncbi:FAD-dependent tricarballylate dehydrogenase TcuA [Caldichromatium japonicum]|uniref:FAD-dependent tricarballylate dehydrogenase TcuA n=1 Tax=Caldichromatium japonicum TaxID=2699430 RepID=A0A6G7VCM0_9GAMM|nr:FAD-dependent tricarballylate dehydrogenase TcuA [Caldichromatium japonicum]QIK37598.1 FAD-dependent tricarballylate dehydrogenase TcuA [Caldichromatium japonicum]